jgi:hypothetical protein
VKGKNEGPIRRKVLAGEGGGMKKLKVGEYGFRYFIYLYKNRTMKPLEIILSEEEENEGRL